MPNNVTTGKPKYIVELEINAPIALCFKGMSSEAGIAQWAPGVKSVVYDHSKATEPYGAGSERLVTLNNGHTMLEIITESVTTPEHCYCSYRLPSIHKFLDVFVKDYGGRFDFKALGENRTKLTWNGYFRSPRGLGLTAPLFKKLLGGMAKTMGNNAKNLFEAEAASLRQARPSGEQSGGSERYSPTGG